MRHPFAIEGNKTRILYALYAAIFLDLFGFGMIIPDIQLRAERLGAPGWLIGAMLASTFVVQLFASPLWGRWSDRIGRKPVLLLCSALSAIGLFIYGFASVIPLLILSRFISGLGGANVAVAQALLADSTAEDERTEAMGRIGAAISVGLIAGPVVGGFLADIGSFYVGLAAGASSSLGVLLILFLVKSAPPDRETDRPKKMLFDFSLLRDLPKVRALAIVAAVAWFSLATLEGTFGRLIKHTMGYGSDRFGIIFGYESLLGFLVQAFLIGWIARRSKDEPLLRFAYILQGLGLGLTPFAYKFPVPAAWMGVLLFCSTLYALGSGFANPTINSLCSKLTPAERQGELFGLMQGARSIGFVVGPVLGGALFDAWFAAPYLLAGLTCVCAAALVRTDRKDGV